jgi:hypothetical protein
MKKTLTLLLAACCWATTSFAQTPTYNFYYGNLHAHSSYSDGNQDEATSHAATPAQDYSFADASLHLDFLGISEHNHAQAGMSLPNYAKGLRQADSLTTTNFVALYGMEWGVISGGGHILVYGVDQLLGWEAGNFNVFVAKNDYQSLFKQINRRPGAFALFAHPQSGDYGNLAGTAAFSPRADSSVVGTPLRSGPATSTNITYSNKSTGSYESTYQRMLAKGYHVGISFDHDNHNTTFGRTTPGRLVVLAPTLTKADLMVALRNRRFYASDDWNTQVNFTLNGQPMGSILQGGTGNAAISVNVADADAEPVGTITLMRGVPGNGVNAVSVATAPAGSAALTFNDTNTPNSAYYYYAIITQPDGDRIVTSPIWYSRSTVTGTARAQELVALDVFPNPVQGGTATLSYALPTTGRVTLEVLDNLGRAVSVLAQDEQQAAGPHAYTLPVSQLNLAPGLYTVRLVQADGATFRKLVVAQ